MMSSCNQLCVAWPEVFCADASVLSWAGASHEAAHSVVLSCRTSPFFVRRKTIDPSLWLAQSTFSIQQSCLQWTFFQVRMVFQFRRIIHHVYHAIGRTHSKQNDPTEAVGPRIEERHRD